ncbi:DUF4157 domain-containing protein [Sporocytophaga myxococcoides]|uniref:eCIS core domain-containing protein n=1 Tax=Sporocytophaga myxococcoides TaxID=153721 RepID=UPI000411A010|nr:DUF4157 domain-containing protein [Sporocytophaga myxococcoides]
MSTHADKGQENKNRSVSNFVSQRQSRSNSNFQFVDNRPEAVAQRKLQDMVNNSQQAKQAAQLQTMVDNSTALRQPPIQKKGNNTGLPDNLKSGIENLSGYSMDDVNVHRNSDKPAQFNAHAYAQGTDIHLAPGQEKHLPHEAWHIVQQKQGRVNPTMQMKGGVNANDDAGLEKEADEMGGKALQAVSYNSQTALRDKGQLKETTIQKKEVFSKKAFADPKDYINKHIDKNGVNDIYEDAGSNMFEGAPMKEKVDELSKRATRNPLIEKIKKFIRDSTKKLEADTTISPQDKKSSEDANQRLARLIIEIEKIKDANDAALFLKQNSLSISKLPFKTQVDSGIGIHVESQKGTGGNDKNIHTFHFDKSYQKIAPTDVGNDQNKADLLNGPWKRGWVPGHHTITNYPHRFIEHVHVNKDKSEDDGKVDIYNTDKRDDAGLAIKHGEKIAAMKLSGKESQAFKNKNESWYENQISTQYPKPRGK